MNQPKGIIKTLPYRFFVNYRAGKGMKQFDKDFLRLNKNNDVWIFNLSGRPKYDVLYFYLLFNGAIHYRANIIGYTLPNKTIDCFDGSAIFGRIWVEVCAPIIKAIDPIPMKGFQGFRYTDILF